MSGIEEEMPNEPGTTTGSPTPLANENSNRNGSDTNLTTNQNRRTYNHNRKTNITGFKGETERMNSNVFQLHSERKKQIAIHRHYGSAKSILLYSVQKRY